MTERPYDSVKRVLDVAVSTVGLIVAAPIMGIVAIVVRQQLGSPVIFKQKRPGRGGEIFTLYKFRTMHNVSRDLGLISNEDRMTSFGRKLRSTSLDELPSLVNVLKGDMSIVGPRPLLVSYLHRYSPQQRRRHEVRPGITGLAQVNGRNSISWEDKLRLDVEYVDRRSLLLDMKIIFQTISQVVQRTGIESEGHVVGAPFTNSGNAEK